MEIKVNLILSKYLPTRDILFLKVGSSWETVMLLMAERCLYHVGIADGRLSIYAPYVLQSITGILALPVEQAILHLGFILSEEDKEKISLAARQLLELIKDKVFISLVEENMICPFSKWSHSGFFNKNGIN